MPKAHTFKDNFWSKLRVERNLTTKEIADYLGEGEKKTSAYFTGFLLPDDNTIRQLCDLFDVDFNTGNLEFQHAHRQYVAEHKRTLKSSAKTTTKQNKAINTVDDVIESLYGNLSCKEFIDIYELVKGNGSSDIDPRRIIYNKVDYDTYNRINDIMSKE